MRHWLMKSEPQVFSLQDLREEPQQTACWEGVRNYQARNFMRDEMQVGDRVLFYHSSCQPPGVAGLARVVRAAYADDTAWDAASPYYDPRSTAENPRWVMVDVRFEAEFPRLLPLAELRSQPALAGMWLLRKGMRLSVQPLQPGEFACILELAGHPAA